jgi:prevent-host-death family protein
VLLLYHMIKTELVTNLKRHATEIIEKLQKEHVPLLITEHGRPAAYLIDVDSYENMNRRIHILEGIAIGEQAIKQGRIRSHKEAKARMSRWLK